VSNAPSPPPPARRPPTHCFLPPALPPLTRPPPRLAPFSAAPPRPSPPRTPRPRLAGVTSWEYPSAHGDAASPVAQPKKKLSIQARAQWRKILDYARREATSKLQSKNKRFLGLRKFAEQAAKRKAEAAEKKRREKEEEEAANSAAAAEALRPKKSIMEMLDVDTPPIEKQNIEEFADAQFNLNRKGFFGKKTTVAKVLSWKNELIRTS
jgi:hypothetical protein